MYDKHTNKCRVNISEFKNLGFRMLRYKMKLVVISSIKV